MIVDDHEVVRDGLAELLESEQMMTVAKCSDEDEALVSIRQFAGELDAVLLDVRLDPGDGFGLLERFRADFPDIRVVVMTSFENITYVARAVALGASDFISKGDGIGLIAASIRAAAMGRNRPEGSRLLRVERLMRSDVDLSTLPSDMPLTGREAQVLRHIALGLSNKEISFSLGISVETVKEHVQNVLRKLEATDRTHAAVRAVKAGIV